VGKAVERRRTEVIKSRATLSEVVVVFFMVNVWPRMEPKRERRGDDERRNC
jgi:hypothetical protein